MNGIVTAIGHSDKSAGAASCFQTGILSLYRVSWVSENFKMPLLNPNTKRALFLKLMVDKPIDINYACLKKSSDRHDA